MEDICCSSGTEIPDEGRVLCPCGIIWNDHDKKGEPLFTVPLHDQKGHLKTIDKVRKALDSAYVVHLRRLEVQREEDLKRRQRAWEAHYRTLTTRTPGMVTDMRMGGTIRGRPR